MVVEAFWKAFQGFLRAHIHLQRRLWGQMCITFPRRRRAAIGGTPAFSNYTFSFVIASTAAVPEPATLMIWGLVLMAAPFGAKACRKFGSAQA